MPKTRKMKKRSKSTEPSCGSESSIELTSAESRGDDLSERNGRNTRITRRPERSGSGRSRKVRYSSTDETTMTKSRTFHGFLRYASSPDQKPIAITRRTSSAQNAGVQT